MSGNVITIGGIRLDRPDGSKYTKAAPVCEYGGLTDDDVNDFWDFIKGNEKIQKALLECQAVVSDELIKLGRVRNG